jgi:hypothetical protein
MLSLLRKDDCQTTRQLPRQHPQQVQAHTPMLLLHCGTLVAAAAADVRKTKANHTKKIKTNHTICLSCTAGDLWVTAAGQWLTT